MRRLVRAVIGVGLCIGVACAPGVPGGRAAKKAMESGRLDEAAQMLEQRRDHYPNDPTAHDELGEAYYRLARKALDEGRSDDYEHDLEQALDEWIESLRLAPERPSPHVWMGILAAYQGDLKRAEQDFQNARRLDPHNPVHYTNLAEVYVYEGDLAKARRYLERGRRLGSRAVTLEMTGALAAWKAGDMVEARDLFDSAYHLDRKEVNTWNEAPVSKPIESFEGMAAFCCSHVACGPYMESACRKERLEVTRRKLRDETARRELVLEMERRRKLREIYEKRRDLKVEVEPAEPAPSR